MGAAKALGVEWMGGWTGAPQALAGDRMTVVAIITPPPWREGWEQNKSWHHCATQPELNPSESCSCGL
jgi:hypothetical protein